MTRKRKRSNNLAPTVVKRLIPLVIGGVFLFLFVFGVYSFLNNAAYFRVKKVTFIGLDDKKTVREISQQFLYDNMFNIDINRVKDALEMANPQFHSVEVVRKLPDELTVKVVQRKPIAQMQVGRFFLVDNDGVVVSDGSSEPFDNFCIIRGLQKVSKLSFGKKINSASFKSGLELVEVLKNVNQELSFLLKSSPNKTIAIDLSHFPSMLVYMGSIELRLHRDYLHRGVSSLKDILPSLKSKINKIEYIDLRFTDPAVSFGK